MEPSLERRLGAIESAIEELVRRLDRLEAGERAPARTGLPAPGPRKAAERPAPQPKPVPARAAPRPAVDLEEFLGGRVLAWVGGLAVVLGIVFFVVMAVSRGWIDESTRVVLAFLGSAALFAAGVYLHEARGQTEAARAAVAASIAGLYASLAAATALYELVSTEAGLGVALVVGATATAIAVRWDSRLVAALGIVGALLAPVLVDADTSGVALAFMAVALLSATGVLVWRRWDWLAVAAFVVSVPQLGLWLHDEYRERLGLALVVLAAFWAVYVVAAAGYELRVPTERLRISSALLLLANALLVAGAGWAALDDTGHGSAATAWVLLVALAHLALGGTGVPLRISNEIAALLVAVAIGLAAVGLALALSGPALVAGWAAEAAIVAWAGRRIGDRRAHVPAGVFLGLAAVHVVAYEAPPAALADGVDDLAVAAVALLAFVAAALVVERSYEGPPEEWRTILRATLGAAIVYLPSLAIVDVTATEGGAEPGQTPQVLLSAFWAATGFATVVYGLLREARGLRLAGLLLLGLAIGKVFLYDLAALDEIYRVLSFVALGLLLLAGAFAYQRVRAQRR